MIPAGGGLADLSRSAHERHLPAEGKVLCQHGIVKARPDLHA
jgi:hypothetical protein